MVATMACGAAPGPARHGGPEGYGWQVYTDPVGHPFCLCRHEGVTWPGKRVVWP